MSSQQHRLQIRRVFGPFWALALWPHMLTALICFAQPATAPGQLAVSDLTAQVWSQTLRDQPVMGEAGLLLSGFETGPVWYIGRGTDGRPITVAEGMLVIDFIDPMTTSIDFSGENSTAVAYERVVAARLTGPSGEYFGRFSILQYIQDTNTTYIAIPLPTMSTNNVSNNLEQPGADPCNCDADYAAERVSANIEALNGVSTCDAIKKSRLAAAGRGCFMSPLPDAPAPVNANAKPYVDPFYQSCLAQTILFAIAEHSACLRQVAAIRDAALQRAADKNNTCKAICGKPVADGGGSGRPDLVDRDETANLDRVIPFVRTQPGNP